MRSDQCLRFSVFGFQKLRLLSASAFLFSALDSSEISNLKSQIRAAAGGRV
jgi:hypothetical protein